MMNKYQVLEEAAALAKNELEKDASGHDWWHVFRVAKLAEHLAHKENADVFICQLAAYLHDVADEKLNESEEFGLKKVKTWLEQKEIEAEVINAVMEIISTMSFKGGNQAPMKTIEGRVVQDADRLDAIGAIGIARTFAYSGAKGQLMYDPSIPVRDSMTKEEYRNGPSTAINHFYEKLFKLKDLMNTESAKEIAAYRHRYMEQFVREFMTEWEALQN